MQKSSAEQQPKATGVDWRHERRSGILIIAVAATISAGIWLAVRKVAPFVPQITSLPDHLIFAFKWWCIAVLLCFATGIDAVAHERLQSPAFDPLVGYETKRLQINLRYLQNTLEQLIMFSAALFGLALYSSGAAVEATAVVWILSRFAFWIGYHRSAAMRSMGAASIALSLIVLLYVVWHIGLDLGGTILAVVVLGVFVIIEAILFWTTRYREPSTGNATVARRNVRNGSNARSEK